MTMTVAQKVDRAVELKLSINQQEKELNTIKAELQSLALAEMENKNIKYLQFCGDRGNCETTYKQKLEIDNFEMLVRTIGNLAKEKIVRKEEVDFEIETRFKKALIAVFKGEYAPRDIDAILSGLGLDAKTAKMAKKKLKGEYWKDKALLESLGVKGDLEEELDAIREAKNMELVERYFPAGTIDMEQLKKSLWLEETLSIAINHKDGDGDAE